MKIKKVQEPFAWPPRSLINIYMPMKHGYLLYQSSTDRLLELDDIADEIIGNRKSGTIYFGLSVKSKKWLTWNEYSCQSIDERIIYDLGFDGQFKVKIERETELPNLPCTEEFLWKLIIKRPN